MTVGERIKIRRKELNMSADYVADRIGVSRSTMFRYESGEIEKLPADALAPIAVVLNTTVEYLMGWSSDVPSPSPAPALSSEETELVTAWRKAEEPIKVSVRKLLDIPAPSEEKEAASSISKAG